MNDQNKWSRLVSRLGVCGLMLSGVALGACTLPSPVHPAPSLPHPAAAKPVATHQLFVATTGSDGNPGTSAKPFKTLTKALGALRPGDTLIVHGGTYNERITSLQITPGRANERIKVVAAPGERPVLKGLLWMKNASYWDFSGINVTWGSGATSTEHMVKFTGGVDWTFTDAEVWGAHSYAAIAIAAPASGWLIARDYVHDTYASNGSAQDHLIYANNGTGGGIIERNLLVGSPNGRAIKVGPPSAGSGVDSNIIIRYNTMVDNLGPSNVGLAWDTSGVQIYRNIMVSPSPRHAAVTSYELTGTGNSVHDNIAWNATGVVDVVPGLKAAGGNRVINPEFGVGYRPTNPAAVGYGHLAPVS